MAQPHAKDDAATKRSEAPARCPTGGARQEGRVSRGSTQVRPGEAGPGDGEQDDRCMRLVGGWGGASGGADGRAGLDNGDARTAPERHTAEGRHCALTCTLSQRAGKETPHNSSKASCAPHGETHMKTTEWTQRPEKRTTRPAGRRQLSCARQPAGAHRGPQGWPSPAAAWRPEPPGGGRGLSWVTLRVTGRGADWVMLSFPLCR